MRIGILGGGAIGSTFAGYLSRHGLEVVVVDRSPEHVAAINDKGLRIGTPDGEWMAKPGASTDPAALAGADVVFISTKTHATEIAADSALPHLPTDALVVTVQNGLGTDRVLADVFGPARVVPGTTLVAARRIGPGHVDVAGRTVRGEAVTHLGPPAGAVGIPPALTNLAAVMSAAGLPTEVLHDARRLVWEKLALSCSITAATAVIQVRVGPFWGHPAGQAIARAMFDEVMALAAAEGVEIDAEATWEASVSVMDTAGEVFSSVSVDLMGGRTTEIDALSAEIARRSSQLGLDAPVSRTVAHYVELLEAFPPAQRPGDL
jgi:2-dehydropantoate 2-reductase